MRVVFAALLAGLWSWCAAAHAAPAFTAAVERAEFSGWAGPPIPVWTYRPRGAGADAPVLFVMHGAAREAQWQARVWAPYAEEAGFIVVAPEFSRAAYPGRDYILGGVLTAEGRPAPRDRWIYASIEKIFDWVVAREGLTTQTYAMFGHSAGAQFTHRFVMFGAGARLTRAIAANAGWYTMPTTEIAWPYGLAGVEPQPAAAFFAAPLIVLLGDQDIDPNAEALAREPEAMAQGPHRFARGHAFYRVARNVATTLAWSCRIAPGLSHDNEFVAAFAAPLLSAPMPEPGAPCARLATPVAHRPLGGSTP